MFKDNILEKFNAYERLLHTESSQKEVSHVINDLVTTCGELDLKFDSAFMENIQKLLGSVNLFSSTLSEKEYQTIFKAIYDCMQSDDANKKTLCFQTLHRIKLNLIKKTKKLGGVKNISVGASVDEKESHLYTVYYGTNRKPIDLDNPSKGYGNERASEVSVGFCNVFVPKSHKFGEIKSSLWDKIIKFDFSHGNLKVKKINRYQNDSELWDELQRVFDESKEKQALIFIHGYNNSFEDAAIRAAQIGVDLKVNGVTAFFSWPSQSKVLGYSSDEATIQVSEKYIKKFITDFVQKSGVETVHLIAHSMGNRGLLRVIDDIQSENLDIKFGQIILAAPDVDADLFREISKAYPKLSQRTTIYASPDDKAVKLSKWLHNEKRVGITPPVSVYEDIDTIEIDLDFDLFELGHGYFANTEALLHDMYDLINSGTNPDNRQRLIKLHTEENKKYWLLNIDN